jgi:hypothetical protein
MLAAQLGWSRDRRAHWLAGALAALAVFLRYQNGLVLVGLVAALLVDVKGGRGEPESAAEPRARVWRFVGAAAVVALLVGGLLDLLTWGWPLHSFVRYVQFNLSGRNALFGPPLPATYYFTALWSSVGPAIIPIVVGLVAARPRWPLIVVAGYVLAHSLVPHKELRFLMPVVPLMLAAAGIGLAQLCGRWRYGAGLTIGIALATAALMGVRTTRETFSSMGQSFGGHSLGDRSPWHAGEDINRLLWNVGVRPDSCGVMVSGSEPAWTGGYTYLHKRIPILWGIRKLESANYLIAPRGSGAFGYEVVRREREFWLYRRGGDCVGGLDRSDPPLP